METPYILIEEKTMNDNLKEMYETIHEKGVQLRPHIKTHKMPEIAKEQVAIGASGITVATLTEAEVMMKHGIRDIFLAYPIIDEQKAKKACQLSRQLDQFIVAVDSTYGVELLQRIAQQENEVIRVRVEIDTGLKRTGVAIEDAMTLISYVLSMNHLHFDGIFTFKGAVVRGEATKDVQAAGREEGELLVALANELRGKRIEVPAISVGSTPTAKHVAEVFGVTEVRPGTYVFYDAMQVKLGVCHWGNCAATVVVTVVSKGEDRVVIDGGSKTFATDVQPEQAPLFLNGFGKVVNYPGVIFTWMNEEHGIIEGNVAEIQIGDKLKIIPNHICSTINLHDFVYVRKENGEVTKMQVSARGKLQ